VGFWNAPGHIPIKKTYQGVILASDAAVRSGDDFRMAEGGWTWRFILPFDQQQPTGLCEIYFLAMTTGTVSIWPVLANSSRSALVSGV
jgi:hypothetical protein